MPSGVHVNDARDFGGEDLAPVVVDDQPVVRRRVGVGVDLDDGHRNVVIERRFRWILRR